MCCYKSCIKSAMMIRWIVGALFILIIDQLSKWLILQNLALDSVVSVLPGCNLQLAFNKGAAFGFLATSAGWQRVLFIGLAILVAGSILVWLNNLTKQDFWEGVALSSILGGALGNLIDRIRLGEVVDFIDLYYKAYHWYTFNIADIAICLGTGILLLTFYKKPHHLHS